VPPAARIAPADYSKHRRRRIEDQALSGETQQEEQLDSGRHYSGNDGGLRRARFMGDAKKPSRDFSALSC
jgi:hypothetical protein